MNKRGKLLHSLTPRYFELFNNNLIQSPGEVRIFLSDFYVYFSNFETKKGLPETMRYCIGEIQKITLTKGNCLQISWGKNQLVLQCSSDQEAQDWYQTIEKARSFWNIKFQWSI